MIQHLTDEQFASLMAGDRSDASARLHVDSCEACRCELNLVGSATNDLSRISMRWAEQHAARIQAPSLWALNWKTLPGWGATMAAVLIFGVALGSHIESSNPPIVAVATPHTMPAPTADELAQDNRLMRSIEDEINEQPGAQTAASAVDDSSRMSRRHGLREVSN
jgi:hypothetical protein